MSHPGKRAFDFLSSYGLSCILFLLMGILTFLGTIEQMETGLYDVQQKYFTSVFLVHDLFGVLPVPLPGAYLLMAFLAVNLLCGGVVRAKKGWTHYGVLTAHIGILILLAGAFIKGHWSEDGHLTLMEGQESNEFESYYRWEVALFALTDGPVTEYLIPDSEFRHAGGAHRVRYQDDALPFGLEFSGYHRNAVPQPAALDAANSAGVYDGFRLKGQPPERDAERNTPGLVVSVTPDSGGAVQEGILWGGQQLPLVVEAGGKEWAIDLRKERHQLPFTVTLSKFTRELHPRTSIPKVFMSDVIKVTDGVSEEYTISMNKPLRESGYTLYQASWGPQNAAPGQPLFSVLAVVKDPAERLPVIASVVTMFGLMYHFLVKLLRHLRAQNRRAS